MPVTRSSCVVGRGCRGCEPRDRHSYYSVPDSIQFHHNSQITKHHNLPGKCWVKFVITLPVKHIKSQSGVELVGFSRETSKYSFIIHVEYLNGVAIEDIKTIGQGKVYYERRLFKLI